MKLFNKKPLIQEQPLGYWEEKSYIQVILNSNDELNIENALKQISNINGVKVLNQSFSSTHLTYNLQIKYFDDEYDVGLYLGNFQYFNMYLNNSFNFTEEEIALIKKATTSLTIFMKFTEDAQKSYHLQLKLAYAAIPNLIAILDESSERLLPAKWVKMTATSNIVPAANQLYMVQAVFDKSNEVWLHTHGLCRCGLTELEILQSDKSHYQSHYNVISTYASYLITQNQKINPHEDGVLIGYLINNEPLIVTCKSWVEGIKEYPKAKLGNLLDRKENHNSQTSIIFIYKNKEDEKNNIISKISLYNDIIDDNPLFFISDKETERMKQLAKEKFPYVQKEASKEKFDILVKIGLPVNDQGACEHIWFQLLTFDGNKFKAKLTQEPYDIQNIKVGDEKWFTVDDITDWIIYQNDHAITPDNAYLLVD